jgi:Na+/proline symporter
MEILAVILLVPLGAVTIVALLAAVNVLFPEAIEKTRANLDDSPGRSLLLGLVNFIFFGLLGLVFFWLSEQTGGGFIGGIFILFTGITLIGMTIFSLLGLSASARLLGERIGNAKTPFAADLRGGALLLLASLAPYVGWFLFLPLILWAGFGAAISALMRRKKEAPIIEE